jgi:hypothetical protein
MMVMMEILGYQGCKGLQFRRIGVRWSAVVEHFKRNHVGSLPVGIVTGCMASMRTYRGWIAVLQNL